MSYLCKYYPK